MRQVFAICLIVTCATSGLAEDKSGETKWGTLRGRFVLEGEALERKIIRDIRRPELFTEDPLLNESLLVDQVPRVLSRPIAQLLRRALPCQPKKSTHKIFVSLKARLAMSII